METEAAQAGELTDFGGEGASEAAPGEADGNDFALNTLNAVPLAGAGTEARTIPGAQNAAGVSEVMLEGLETLVVG